MADCCITSELGFDISTMTELDCTQLGQIRLTLYKRLFEEAMNSTPWVVIKGRRYDMVEWQKAVRNVIAIIDDICGPVADAADEFVVTPAVGCSGAGGQIAPGAYVLKPEDVDNL